MKFPAFVLSLALLVLAGCPGGFESPPVQPLLTANFEQDPNAAGWRYVRGRTPKEFQPWQADPADANRHCIATYAEPNDAWTFWDGPAFDVEPLRFYRVSLRYRAEDRAYVSAIFLDANGRPLEADNYTGLDKAETWRQGEMIFMAKFGAVKAKIRLRPERPSSVLRVCELAVTASSPSAACQWITSVGQSMPKFDYAPPAGRLQRLPLTAERLRTGGKLRILMLGDSIINDTGNSLYPALLAADCPRTQLEVITSVRGGTGCSFYQGKDRVGVPNVQRYVLDYQPDLVIIGGISHGFDAEAIGAVISQIQTGCKAEILVTTGAVAVRKHQVDSFLGDNPRWREKQKPRVDNFPVRLQQICDEKGAEFWDTRTDWDNCVAAIGKGDDWLMRDDTHANSRGWYVLARMFESYFKP